MSGYSNEDWALVYDGGLVVIGMNWLSYDNFGENMRQIDAILAYRNTQPDGADYEVADYVFDCNQPRMRIQRGSSFRLDGSAVAEYPASVRVWQTVYSEAPSGAIRVQVCGRNRPGFGDFEDAGSFVAHVRNGQ